jgi:flagellar hook assembly protein FlgD
MKMWFSLILSSLILFIYPTVHAGGLDYAHAFPVPFESSKSQSIKFVDMNTNNDKTIKIFNVRGQLIRSISVKGTSAYYDWDVTNDSGNTVASGVYFFIITSGDDIAKGKLIIVR